MLGPGPQQGSGDKVEPGSEKQFAMQEILVFFEFCSRQSTFFACCDGVVFGVPCVQKTLRFGCWN